MKEFATTQTQQLVRESKPPNFRSPSKRKSLLRWLRRKMTPGCEQQQQHKEEQEKAHHRHRTMDSSSSSGSEKSAGDEMSSQQPPQSNGSRQKHHTQKQQQQQPQQPRRRSKHNTRKPSLSPAQQALLNYVPDYLKPFVHPYHGEFCYTPIFQPRFIAQLMAEGFLPVATKGMLLPKLHLQRSVIDLPHGLHVGKSVRKKSKRFSITLNQQFDQVIEACQQQHGRHCWLYPPLVAAFRDIWEAGHVDAAPLDPTTGLPLAENVKWTVRFYTVEVWNVETGALAGGEIGYTVGSIYTSLTGFTKEDSAGSVQLAALGRLLSEKGFHMWDLGMDMEYKKGIGSELMPRETFVSEVHRVRQTCGHLVLPVSEPPQNCKDVIDRNNPQAPLAAAAAGRVAATNVQKQEPEKKEATPKQAESVTNDTARDSNSPNKEHSPPPSESDVPIKKIRKSNSRRSHNGIET